MATCGMYILSINRTASAPNYHLSFDQGNNGKPGKTQKASQNQVQNQQKIALSTSPNVNLPPMHQGLTASSLNELKKLAEYEKLSGGTVADGIMTFTDIPDNISDAKSHAAELATTLKEFAKFGIKPIVVMEPTNSGGTVDFSLYRQGGYDDIINALFQNLKDLGLTDKTIGMWVYFPEANLPQWGPVDIADFAPNVVRSVNIQKRLFPNSQATILLDAESYPAGSTDWSAGSYTSLAPFISGIPHGLLDSFGLQGFPWAPPANQNSIDASYDPKLFLDASLASAAASLLSTKNIWFNTGTFASMYTSSSSETVNLNASQRQIILDGVVNQALALKKHGFGVAINLFCQNKSNTNEAIDWSYSTTDSQAVFKNFAQQLYGNNLEMWLFDS